MTARGGESAIIPEGVTDAVKRSLVNVESLRVHLMDFLALSEPDVLAELPPLCRARALLLLAQATSTLLTLQLRCNGVHADDHPVKTELERLSLYEEKLERNMAVSKAPLRPSATLNSRAATRFIEHSLSDLTAEQKQSMRKISSGEVRSRHLENRKRKYQSSDRKSVRAAAAEFLEKAQKELLGGNKEGEMKGPLRFHSSDEED